MGGRPDLPIWRKAWDSVVGHPLLTTAAIATVVAGCHAVWIWKHRHLGGFDPDEASYLSAALRIHRSIDLSNPLAPVFAMAASGHGVTVPALSVPLLIIGPRDPRMAMMVQPLLLIFIAVSTAGITRKLANDVAAIVAGTWVVMLPTITTAVQSYWYGLGAAASMAGAVWALLASDGGRNRRIWLYGACIGLMLLSRTMTLGYLPACAVAGLVVAWPDRRSVLRTVGAVGLGVAIAAPWYFVNREAIFGYLFSFGYGENAALFGEAGLVDRLSLRWMRFANGYGLVGAFRGLLFAIALAGAAVLIGRCVLRAPGATVVGRRFLAVSAAVVIGTLALLSTANNGVWFELPLVVLGVPLLVAGAAQLPRTVSVPMAVVVIVLAASALPAALWLRPWAQGGASSHYEYGFSEYDERFAPANREGHPEAAREWWLLSRRMQREMRRISPDGRSAVFAVVGNTHLWNANTLRMSSELDAWDPELWGVDTTRSPAERRADLTPTVDLGTSGTAERVLVVGEHDQILWTLDAEVRSFARQAGRAGFVEVRRFTMPRGGDVVLLRHEDR